MANNSPQNISENKYKNDSFVLQLRHFPFRNIKEKMGINSYHDRTWPHFSQWDLGLIIDSFLTTLKPNKL